MKRLVVFLLSISSLSVPASLWAQGYEDEVYYVPSKEDKGKDKVEIVFITSDVDASASSVEEDDPEVAVADYSGSYYTEDFDVDAYNRRYENGDEEYYDEGSDGYEAGESYYASASSGDGEEVIYVDGEDADVVIWDDDDTYTARIIRFRNPSLRIYLDSPYWIWDPYWDYIYDPWYYGPWYSSLYWGYPYGGWGWSVRWGWYAGWHYHPGWWTPNHHYAGGWRPRNVTNRMGWRGTDAVARGFMRNGNSSGASMIATRGFSRNGTTSNRSLSTVRRTTNNQTNGNTRTNNSTVTRRTRSSGTTSNRSTAIQQQSTRTRSTERSTIQRSSVRSSINRSTISSPSTGFGGASGGSRSGSVRSGGSRSGGR